METKKDFFEERLGYLKFKYEKKAHEWASCTDDRKLFSNLYFILVRACESLIGHDNTYVICAMIHAMEGDIGTMNNIMERFKGE